jgi:hypothetical protein
MDIDNISLEAISEFKRFNKEIKAINEEIKALNKKSDELVLKRRKVCPHLNVKLTGGEEWYLYPESGHTPYILRCNDCGLHAENRYEDRIIWDLLDKSRR